MTKKMLIEKLINQANAINMPEFILCLVLSAALGLLIGLFYIKFGHSLSNRRVFARNFLLVAVTTTLIITIVKSSLALSLGLVGALSIVRFRAAIKEPEELAYLFLTISIGLGLGAGQILLSIVAVVIILGLILIQNLVRGGKTDDPNLYVTVTTSNPHKISLSQMMDLLQAAGATASLKRYDDSTEMLEAAFLVDFKQAVNIERFNHRLRELNPHVKVSCLDDQGLGL
ncbi:DUF4956 domain-containing protein [bacterium]|nr:DUF4956 domain-containing protein [bacterium]